MLAWMRGTLMSLNGSKYSNYIYGFNYNRENLI